MVVYGQSGCIRVKVVLIGQKLFFSGKSDCFWAKVVVIGQCCCIRSKVVVSGKSA